MGNQSESLDAIRHLAQGRQIGSEAMFTYSAALEALTVCSQNGVAVLGVELFRERPDGYLTESISTYERHLEGVTWSDFVQANNALAAEFIRRNPGESGQFYVFTAASEREFSNLRAL